MELYETHFNDEQGLKVFNPWNIKNVEITSRDVIHILSKYGWKGRITNMELFSRACCHKSYSKTDDTEPVDIQSKPDGCLDLRDGNNEELEFLGDRIIGFIVSLYVVKRYPNQGEGFMTKILSRITNNNQLGKLARAIGLSKWIVLSRHMEDICNGRNNLRVLGSFFEAWIGALYLQEDDTNKGMKICQNFIISIIEKHIDFVQFITEDTNYKDQLLRLFQSLYHVPPRYKELSVEGPIHDRYFTMGVVNHLDEVISHARARNKKSAEQEASRIALDILNENLPPT